MKSAADVALTSSIVPTQQLKLRLSALICRIFGHLPQVSSRTVERRGDHQCLCGTSILREDGTETHVRHNLACFFFGHRYVRMGERNEHHEYVCVNCGHPLLFAPESSYAGRNGFHKQVRYLCGLFGHRVHLVGERLGFAEYACHCGHSFLQRESVGEVIRHPLICIIAGHYITHIDQRLRRAEYCCRNCGHTFYFPK